MEENFGQEMLQKAIMLKEESEEIERQLNFVNEQIAEMKQFVDGLRSLKENKKNEILANIGKGVYMKAIPKEEEKFFVEVGAGVIVRKSLEETEKVVEGQMQKFQEARLQLTAKLQEQANEFHRMLAEVEKMKPN